MSARATPPGGGSEGRAHAPGARHAEGRNGPQLVTVTVVVANRYPFDTDVATGRQLKERANVPADFSLFRRTGGGNEPIQDDETVELSNGDHFFARPPSLAGAHDDEPSPG